MSASSSSTLDGEHQRSRLRLYVQVLLIVDVMAHIDDDLISPLLFGEATLLAHHPAAWALRNGATLLLFAVWAGTKWFRPALPVLILSEGVVTLGLAATYSAIAVVYVRPTLPPFDAIFGLVGTLLLLVTRASLVPSGALRTIGVGLGSMGLWGLINQVTLRTMDPVAIDGLIFIGMAFIVATASTSRVIYGLRREVRKAQRLGQYELGRKLGEGGMGEVYQATHVLLRRPTAVKLLPSERAGEKSVARFEREVVQTSRLEHPNSVMIYDYGHTPEGTFYYAMELVDGVTLAELVDEDGPVPQERVVHILRQAAAALAEAHERGLVHRDVKPANIMLCQRAGVPDTVKVLDFGLVKETDNPAANPDLSQADTVMGTPHYLAPEAITAPDTVGPAADVYALGAVGYFLLTGNEVFSGASVIEVCSKHLNEAPAPLATKIDEAVDPRLESLLLRCLAKEAEARPQDGLALTLALDELGLRWPRKRAAQWWANRASHATSSSLATPSPTQLDIDMAAR